MKQAIQCAALTAFFAAFTYFLGYWHAKLTYSPTPFKWEYDIKEDGTNFILGDSITFYEPEHYSIKQYAQRLTNGWFRRTIEVIPAKPL